MDDPKTVSVTPLPPEQSASTLSQVPGPILLRLFTLLTSYLLYERREETPLQLAFIQLVRERHAYFHADKSREPDDDGWLACRNQACVQSRLLLGEGRKPEVTVNPLGAQLMGEYEVTIQSDKVSQFVRAVLVERKQQLTIPQPPRPEGSIIIGG